MGDTERFIRITIAQKNVIDAFRDAKCPMALVGDPRDRDRFALLVAFDDGVGEIKLSRKDLEMTIRAFQRSLDDSE